MNKKDWGSYTRQKSDWTDITASPNELTYGCPLTALQINVNCIKILIRPFESHILAQNVKNRSTVMYDERF